MNGILVSFLCIFKSSHQQIWTYMHYTLLMLGKKWDVRKTDIWHAFSEVPTNKSGSIYYTSCRIQSSAYVRVSWEN